MADIYNHRCRWFVALFLMCAAYPRPVAADFASFQQELVEAEKLRITDPKRFDAVLDQLEREKEDATPAQLDYLSYLRAYDFLVYKNEPEISIQLAKQLFSKTRDQDLKFRTGSFLVNTYASSRHFSEGLRLLNQTLPMRDKVVDKDVRHTGINGAGIFYNEMGQYALGLRYAEEVLSDQPSRRNRCVAGMYRQEAL